MDTKRFVLRRKQLGYSQVDLCRGICTQSTLSKFESVQQVPALAILSRLCARLGLTIDDLNRQDSGSLAHYRELLNLIEEALMIEDFPRARDLLKAVEPAKLPEVATQLHYAYLKGLNAVLTNQPVEELVVAVTPITRADPRRQTIFGQLAQLCWGIYYLRKGEEDRAAAALGPVEKYLRQTLLPAGPTTTAGADYFQPLTIMYYLAAYHHQLGEGEQSQELIELALDLCAVKHVTYYLPQLKLLTAKNQAAAGADPVHVAESLNDAAAFARLNRNQSLLVQVAAFRKRALGHNDNENQIRS